MGVGCVFISLLTKWPRGFYDPPLFVLIGNKHDALATISMNLRLQLLKLLQILRGKTGNRPLTKRLYILASFMFVVPI